jgi:hypothetical protein
MRAARIVFTRFSSILSHINPPARSAALVPHPSKSRALPTPKNLALFFVYSFPVLSLTLFPTISNEPTANTPANRPDFLLPLAAISAARELRHASENLDHIENTLCIIGMGLSKISIRVSLYCVVAQDGVRGCSFLE